MFGRKLRVLVTVASLAGTLVPIAATSLAAGAGAVDCPALPPVRTDSRLDAVTVDGVPVEVLRPPGYDLDDRRYPVLYLLHGTIAHGLEAWPNNSDVIDFTAQREGDRAAIVVMPGGDWWGLRMDWRDPDHRADTFFTSQLIPYIDANYRTLGDAAYRAVAGLSGGGFGALHLLAHHPDLLAVAGSFSGSGDVVTTFGGPLAPSVLDTAAMAVEACRGNVDPLPICGADELCWRSQNPADVAMNLRGRSVYDATGNGVPCDAQDVRDMLDASRPSETAAYQLEPAIKYSNDRQDDAFRAAGLVYTYDTLPCGVHTWRYWNRDLQVFWDEHMLPAFGAAAPASYSYRTSDPQFSVWGWAFVADVRRAPEFLDVTDASCAGVTLTGSGETSVTTGSCFAPGSTVRVTGAVQDHVVVDDHGRVTFTVSLGPAHSDEQFTPAGKLAATSAGTSYWTMVTTTFDIP